MTLNKPLLSIFNEKKSSQVPIWLMRQAGRYLPEYWEVKNKAKNFLDFCQHPELTIEATLQPIRRFDFDAAIIFSDILVIPDAMNMKVEFIEHKGPIVTDFDINNIAKDLDLTKLNPVYKALKGVRRSLPIEKTLIGFAGAPWTLATYMIEGQSSKTFNKTKLLAYSQPDKFNDLLHTLSNHIASHLINQIEAGAEVVQIFDSWASSVPYNKYEDWIMKPTKLIVDLIKENYNNVPIIGFPRGSGHLYNNYAKYTGVDAISIDELISPDLISPSLILQGGLDPNLLVAGGKDFEDQVTNMLAYYKDRKFIFNLGHGILPSTPIAHVEKLVNMVRSQ